MNIERCDRIPSILSYGHMRDVNSYKDHINIFFAVFRAVEGATGYYHNINSYLLPF